MLNIKKLLTKILGAFKVTQLTTTYTSNSYVTSTSFGRITIRRYGALLIVNGNLGIDAAIPKSSSFLRIGSVSLPSNLTNDIMLMVPCATSGTIMVDITSAGVIQLYNYFSTSCNGWARFMAVGILSGGVL